MFGHVFDKWRVSIRQLHETMAFHIHTYHGLPSLGLVGMLVAVGMLRTKRGHGSSQALVLQVTELALLNCSMTTDLFQWHMGGKTAFA